MMTKPLRALMIEDSAVDAELLALELERAGFQTEFERVDTAEELRQALEEKNWDIIFSDHSMPQFNSLEALQICNESGLDIPFIILSGTIGEEQAVEAMKAGASDYMIKGKAARLIPAVNRELHDAKEREKRRKTEKELEHFVASLTHDLRTPLLAESRIFELFDTEVAGTLNNEQHELVSELRQSNRFMQHMVNNILYVYKYKQQQIRIALEPVQLNLFLSRLSENITVQSLLHDKNHQITLQLYRPLPLVALDENEMQRVLLNLIKNAVDHAPPNTPIQVSTTLLPDGQWVRVGVQDQGAGIDPAIQPYLFMPYATSAAKKYRKVGIGLGLYLSKQIVEAHGGAIGFESIPGQGTCFYFDLPIMKE